MYRNTVIQIYIGDNKSKKKLVETIEITSLNLNFFRKLYVVFRGGQTRIFFVSCVDVLPVNSLSQATSIIPRSLCSPPDHCPRPLILILTNHSPPLGLTFSNVSSNPFPFRVNSSGTYDKKQLCFSSWKLYFWW